MHVGLLDCFQVSQAFRLEALAGGLLSSVLRGFGGLNCRDLKFKKLIAVGVSSFVLSSKTSSISQSQPFRWDWARSASKKTAEKTPSPMSGPGVSAPPPNVSSVDLNRGLRRERSR